MRAECGLYVCSVCDYDGAIVGCGYSLDASRLEQCELYCISVQASLFSKCWRPSYCASYLYTQHGQWNKNLLSLFNAADVHIKYIYMCNFTGMMSFSTLVCV